MIVFIRKLRHKADILKRSILVHSGLKTETNEKGAIDIVLALILDQSETNEKGAIVFAGRIFAFH
jgi:hypothetical protein